MIADRHHLTVTVLDCFASPVSFLRHNQCVKVVYKECGYQRIGGRSKRSDLASARQIMASSPEKVQVDPKASNNQKAANERADGWLLLGVNGDRTDCLLNTGADDLIGARR